MSRLGSVVGAVWFVLVACGVSSGQLGGSFPQPSAPAQTAPAPPQGLGQLLINDAQSGSLVRLNVARYHVNVVLSPPVALVQIDQSFHNPHGRQEQGTFVFNLPRGASVSRFAMYVTPDKLIEGELIERQRASEIYESIVNRRRDPAILEQIGDNLFRMRVFPILANDTKRILLDYTIPLETEDGVCDFQLPLFSDLAPIWDFRLGGVIRAANPIESVSSESYPELEFQTQDDRSITFEMVQQNYDPKTDFTLQFTQRAESEATLQSYVADPLPVFADDPWSRGAGTYFLATIQPDEEMLEAERPPADALILVDTSQSMRGSKAVGRVVRELLESLAPEDRFRLMAVDVAARPIHEGWIAAEDAAGVEGVLAKFDQEFCLGSTNLAESISEAIKSFDGEKGKRRRLVVYVGDGDDTFWLGPESEWPDVLPEDDPAGLTQPLLDVEAAFFGVLVRKTNLFQSDLETLTRQSGGLLFDVASRADDRRAYARWRALGLPRPIRIVRIETLDSHAVDLFYPAGWLPGERLEIYGRTRRTDKVELTLTLEHRGQTRERTWSLAIPDGTDTPDDVFVGRLWAQKKLDQLMSIQKGREAGPYQADPNAIVGLSQEWSLLSPYTAFLVLESERDYERWDIDRRMRRRYWRPADGQPPEPLPGDWLARVAPLEEKAPEAPPQPNESVPLEDTLQAARESLASGDFLTAHGILQRAGTTVEALQSEEFIELSRRTLEKVRVESFLDRLGPARNVFDPTAAMRPFDFRSGANRLLVAPIGVSESFKRRHPYYEQMLTEIEVPHWLTLNEFAELVKRTTRGNVMLDLGALEMVGMDGDSKGGFLCSGRMSLYASSRHFLRGLDLVMIEEPNRILITTPEEAEETLRTEVLPVGDLLLAGRATDPSLLCDPYFDHQQAVKHRLREKLRRPISVDCEEAPLGGVINHYFAKVLGVPVLLDSPALDDVGLGSDSPVSGRWQDVPGDESLRWLLKDLDLTYILDNEAVVITTPEEAEERQTVRLHSGLGLLYEIRLPRGEAPTSLAWQPGFGGRGGGMGMGGGFGGGGFGGMSGMGGAMAGSMHGGSLGGRMGGGMTWDPMPGAEAGMSAGGDPLLEEGPIDFDSEEAEAEPETETIAAQPAPDNPTTSGGPVEYAPSYDVDSMINMVVNTVEPISWDDVGGPGSVEFFRPSLDFVVRQTDEIHDEIAQLFNRLRETPMEIENVKGHAMAETLPPGARNVFEADFDSLIWMIESCVEPESWDDVGGSGSLVEDRARAALVIRQTDEIHDQVSQLLMMLRRSRYRTLHGTEPWKQAHSAEPAGGRPWIGGLPLADVAFDPQDAILPKAEPRELALLGARRTAEVGQWTWQYTGKGGSPRRSFTLTRVGRRMEIDLADGRVRIDGDAAAVAHPSLAMVELGNWGEAARLSIDAQLPWLPHRSNEELARWFDVRPVEDVDEADVVRLRLYPPQAGPTAETFIEAAFSAETGRPVVWESHADGEVVGRFEFIEPVEPLAWRTVVLRDGAGVELARWELVDSTTDVPSIAELADDWDGLVRLDLRSPETTIDPAFRRAMRSIREQEWESAIKELGMISREYPDHPLLLLLSAWCFEHDRRYVADARIVDMLSRVAAEETISLTRFIAAGRFSRIEPRDLYEILRLSPESRRETGDWDDLAAAAVDVGFLEEALEHVERARSLDTAERPPFNREWLRVDLLLRLGRAGQALETANAWRLGQSASRAELAMAARRLHEFGHSGTALGLFAKALEGDGLEPGHRYDLLLRLADIQLGVARWRTLLEAAETRPDDWPRRRRCIETITQEMDRPRFAEVAAMLAEEAQRGENQLAFWLRQAELTDDPAVAGDIVWRLNESGQLTDGQLAWACGLWNGSQRPERVVQVVEARLRAGHDSREPGVRGELAKAYELLDRPLDARRAWSIERPRFVPVEVQPAGAMGPRRGGGFM